MPSNTSENFFYKAYQEEKNDSRPNYKRFDIQKPETKHLSAIKYILTLKTDDNTNNLIFLQNTPLKSFLDECKMAFLENYFYTCTFDIN